jgi:hypothetical protein
LFGSGIPRIVAYLEAHTIITFEKESAGLADVDEVTPTVIAFDEAIRAF